MEAPVTAVAPVKMDCATVTDEGKQREAVEIRVQSIQVIAGVPADAEPF